MFQVIKYTDSTLGGPLLSIQRVHLRGLESVYSDCYQLTADYLCV